MAKRKNSGARPTELAPPASLGGEPESLGFALRLESGRALLDLRDRPLTEGIRLNRLEMEIPNVRFPFDVTGGAERFHSTRCLLRSLVLELSLDTLRGQLERHSVKDAGFSELEAVPENGALTVTGVYQAGNEAASRTLFSFAIAPVIMAPRELALLAFDERIYGRANVPAPRIPWLLLQSIGGLDLKSDEPIFDVVAMSVRELLPRFGWKIPDTSDVGIIQAEVAKSSWVIACGRSLLDEAKTSSRVSFVVEARAPFEDIEKRLYHNEDDAAFAAYRKWVDEDSPPRFAVRRFLQLAAADERRFEEGRSVAEEALLHDAHNGDALLYLAQYARFEGEQNAAAKYFARAAETFWTEKADRAATLADVTAARMSRRTDPDLARTSLLRALKKRKSDVRALRELFAIERQGEDWKTATHVGERLLRALPHEERFPIHVDVGELLIEHDLKKAKLHAERALRASMDHPDAIHLVSKVFARQGDVPRAVRYLSRLSERYIALGDMEKATAIEIEIAEHMESTQYEQDFDARALLGRYQRILTLDPDLRRATRRAAQLAFELGETTAAKRWFEEIAEAEDEDPGVRAEAAFRLGQIAMSEEREADAEASFKASVSGPFAEEAYAALKGIYERRDDRPALYGLEGELAARSRSDAEALEHHLRAATLALAEDMGVAAIQHLESALQIAPADHLVKRKLVDVVQACRGPESVEALLQSFAPREHEPTFRAEWFLELAALRENRGDMPGAKAALDSAVAADPTSVEANEALYSLCQKINEPYGAFAALGNLARYRTSSEEARSEIRITQAELLAGSLKRRDEARAYLLRALIDVPHHIRGLKLLGQLALEAEDWAMATDAWTRYLETGAEDGRADALASLAKLAHERGDLQAQFTHLFELWQLTGEQKIFDDMTRVLKERGDFQRLVLLLRDAADASPGDKAAAIRYETALVLRDSVGDWAGARAELTPILDDPDEWGIRAREMLVSLALDEGRFDLLAEALEKQLVFATRDDVPALKLQIARAYRDAQDEAAAVATYQWVLEHDPDNDEALGFLADFAEQTGDAEQAYTYQLSRFRQGNAEALPALVRVTEQVPASVLIANIPLFDKVPPRYALEIAGRLDAEGSSQEAVAAVARALEGVGDAAERAPLVLTIARIEEASMGDPQRAIETLKRERERSPDYVEWRDHLEGMIERSGSPLQKGELQLERAYRTGDDSLMWQAFEALLDVAPEHAQLGAVFDKVALQPALRPRVIAFLERDTGRAIVGDRQRAKVMFQLHEQERLQPSTQLVLARLLRRLAGGDDGADLKQHSGREGAESSAAGNEHERSQALYREIFEQQPEDEAIFSEWREGADGDEELDAIDARRVEVLAHVYKERNDIGPLAELLEAGVERGLVPRTALAQVRDLHEQAGSLSRALELARQLCAEAPTVTSHWLRRAELALGVDAAEVVSVLDELSSLLPTLDDDDARSLDIVALERRFAEALIASGHTQEALALAVSGATKDPGDRATYVLLARLLAEKPVELLPRTRAFAEASSGDARLVALREWLRVAGAAGDHTQVFAAYTALAAYDALTVEDIDAAATLLDEHPEMLEECWTWSAPLLSSLSLETKRRFAAVSEVTGEEDIRARVIDSLTDDERTDSEVEFLARHRAHADDPEGALELMRTIAFIRVVRATALRELWLEIATLIGDTQATLQLREALAADEASPLPTRIDLVEALLQAHHDERAFVMLEELTQDPGVAEDPRAPALTKQFHHLLYDNARTLLTVDPQRALRYSQRLLTEAPDSEEAWLLSVDAARLAQDDERLIDLLSTRPLSAELSAELGEARARTGRDEAAATAYLQAYELTPQTSWLEHALAAIERSGDELRLAETLVRYAVGEAERPMLERALALYAHIGDPARVSELAQRLFEEDPTDDGAYERYQTIVMAQEDALELARVWRRRAASAEDEERRTLAHKLARLHIEKLFEHEVAEQALAEIYPEGNERYRVLYGIYAALDDELRAAQIARRLFEAAPGEDESYARLRAHVERGGSVIELFELLEARVDALDEAERAPVAIEAAHMALEKLHDTDSAERVLSKAFSDERAFLERALELYEAHGYEDKEQELTARQFELEPENEDFYRRHRHQVEQRSDFQALVTLLERRASVMPAPESAELGLEAARIALDSAGDPERAAAVLDSVFGPDTRDVAVLQLKIDVHQRLGNDPEAMSLLEGLAGTTEQPSEKADYLLQASRIAERLGDSAAAATSWAHAMLALPVDEEIARRDMFFPSLAPELRAEVSEALIPRLRPDEQLQLELELSDHYESTHELGTALDFARRALEHDPENVERRARVAALLEKLGQTESLVQLLSEQHATSLDRNERYRLAMEVGLRCERDLNDVDQAIHFYRQAVKDDPTQLDPLRQLVRLYNATGATAERTDTAETLAELLTPGDERGMLCLQIGEWRTERGELDKAALAYLHAFSEGHSTPAARRSVRVATKRGQYIDEAIRGLMHIGEAGASTEQADALKDAAEITAETRQDYVTAAELLRRAIDLAPPSREDRMRLVEWLERSGQPIEALNELLVQVEHEENDNNRLLLLRRASGMADQSGLEEAKLLVFEKRMALGKTTIDEQLNFAETLKNAGRNEDALRIFEQALESADTTEVRARIKTKLVALGLADIVIRSLLAVTGPRRGQAICEAARLYETTGEDESAYGLYREALTERLELSGSDLARIAVLAEQKGDDELLGEAYLRIAESDADAPTRANAYFSMAKLWLDRLGDATRAEDALRLSLKAQPSHLGAQRMLARLLVEQGRLDEAKHYLDALEPSQDENDASWMVRAAEAVLELGDTDKARALLAPLAGKDDAAFWSLFEVESKTKNHGAAVRILVERIDAQQPISDPNVLVRGAEHARLAGIRSAEEKLLAALSDHGGADAESYARLAELALQRADIDSAHKWTVRRADLLESQVERGQALFEAGKLSRRLGNIEEAQHELEMAFDLQPEDLPILTELFELYRAASDAERLLMVGERMVIVDPNGKRPQSFYLALADAAEATRTDPSRVLEFYQLAAGVEQLSSAALEKAIVAAENAGRDPERLDWEEERLTHVQGTEEDYLRLGMIARDRLDDVARAERYFRLAKSTNPRATAPVHALAALLAPNKEKSAEAIALYKELVARQPLDPEPYRLLARLYGQQQDTDRTFLYYDALRALDPSDEEAERFVAAAQQVVPELPPRGLGKNELGHIADQGLLSPLQQFFGPLAAQAELLYATDLAKLGLSEADAVSLEGEEGERLALLMQRMGGRALEVQIYRAKVPGKDAIVEPGAPAKLVLSSDVFELSHRGVQYVVCRALAFLSLGHLLPNRLPPRDLGTLMGLMAKRFVPELAIADVPADRANFVIERFRTTTPDETWAGHVETARKFATELFPNTAALHEQAQQWSESGERTADRWALLMAGDLAQAFAYQKHTGASRLAALPPRGPQRLQAIGARADLLDLLAFSISDTYLAVRQALGLTLQR